MYKNILLIAVAIFVFINSNAQVNQVVTGGSNTSAINFPNGGCVYKWTNSNPEIGLASGGTGNISSFTAVNKGSSPIVATITATPVPSPLAYIANSGSDNVSVVSTITNTLVTTIPVGSSPFGVSVSQDGNSVYVTNKGSNTISVIATKSNTVTATIPVGNAPQGIVVSPDGKKVYVANSGDNTVKVIDAGTNTVSATIPVGQNPYGIAESPDEREIYVTNYDSNNISVINPSSNTVTATIAVEQNPTGVAFGPDGTTAYVSNTFSISVSVINVINNSVVTTLRPNQRPFGIVADPKGQYVYFASTDGYFVIIDLSNYYFIIKGGGGNPQGVSITPDGSTVFVADYANGIVYGVQVRPFTGGSSTQVGNKPISLGNFISNGPGCTAPPITVTITVNPEPVITTGPVSGTNAACAGAASVNPDIQQFTVSGSGLNGDIMANAPAGFEVSANPGNGYGSNLILKATGGAVAGTVIYVRLANNAPAGTPAGVVTLTSPGSITQAVSISGVVSAPVSPAVIISASAGSVCMGVPVYFNATVINGGSRPVYQWLINGTGTGTNSPLFTGIMLQDGDIISSSIISNAACAAPVNTVSNTIQIHITDHVYPAVTIVSSAVEICQGTSVTFTATPENGGSNPIYQWQVNGNNEGTNNSVFSTANLNNGDKVTCILTSNAACVAPAEATSNTLTALIDPLPSVNAGGDKQISAGNRTLLNATATGNITSITWMPTVGLSDPNTLTPFAGPAVTTTYALTVETSGGCFASDSLTVNVSSPVVQIPNTFSPNNDGINDIWNIKYLAMYPQCIVNIFNRWGQKVYTSIGYGNPWDGTYQGTKLPAGTYYYIIDLQTPNKLSGWVTLIK